jgi:hypothetical protein
MDYTAETKSRCTADCKGEVGMMTVLGRRLLMYSNIRWGQPMNHYRTT